MMDWIFLKYHKNKAVLLFIRKFFGFVILLLRTQRDSPLSLSDSRGKPTLSSYAFMSTTQFVPLLQGGT